MRVRRPKLKRPRLPSIPPTSGWSPATRRVTAVGALALAAGAGAVGGYAIAETGSDDGPPAPAPTFVVGDDAPQPEAAEELGFPAFATRNTTRVGGGDPTAVAAGVALASYPSVGGVGGPPAAVLAPAESWQAALAASSLAADPISAPILLGRADEIPGFTAEALTGLAPAGVEAARGVQLIAVGDVITPGGLETLEIEGRGYAKLAAEIDRQRSRLGGPESPAHILVVSGEEPALAMPAAAWAARSGDPILFAARDEVPKETLEVIERHKRAPIYVLGPESVISAKVVRELEQAGAAVNRVGAADPVENSIAFARYIRGDFGWNINDPGHGFTIANSSRPTDAAAAAPLAAGGKPGPLLVTDSAEEVPRALRAFLLDTKPGFDQDPARAFFNHIWLIGDTEAISLGMQAQIDELTKLVPVRRGEGGPRFGAGGPEPEAPRDPG